MLMTAQSVSRSVSSGTYGRTDPGANSNPGGENTTTDRSWGTSDASGDVPRRPMDKRCDTGRRPRGRLLSARHRRRTSDQVFRIFPVIITPSVPAPVAEGVVVEDAERRPPVANVVGRYRRAQRLERRRVRADALVVVEFLRAGRRAAVSDEEVQHRVGYAVGGFDGGEVLDALGLVTRLLR